MKKTILSLLLLAFCCGCRTEAQVGSSPPRPVDVTMENYPRIDGSTSTLLLGQMLAARAWGYDASLRRVHAPRFDYAGSLQVTFSMETPIARIVEFQNRWQQRTHRGTHEAYVALARGQADLILVARLPTAAETALARTNALEWDPRPVALDALVFLVNRRNSVDGLTRAQLQEILTGKTRLWRALNGPDWPILVLTRNAQSGSQELLETLVLPGMKPAGNEETTVITEMGQLIHRVAANENAIGYSVWYYEKNMAPVSQNKTLAVDGVAPTREEIAARRYPFVAPVYAVTRAGLPPTSPAVLLRDWLLGPDGQKLVSDAGCIPATGAP